MSNRTITVTISQDQLDSFAHLIDEFALAVGNGFVPLTPSEIQSLAKPRRNAATIVSSVANLCTRYGVASPSNPTAPMVASQEIATTLGPTVERVNALKKLLDDLVLAASSDAWRSAIVNYALLKTEARANPALKTGLQPVRDAMKPRKVRVQTKPPVAPTPPEGATKATT
jgi:hypothetical protein